MLLIKKNVETVWTRRHCNHLSGMALLRIHACCHPTANKFEVKPCPFILRWNTRAQFGSEKRRAMKEGDEKKTIPNDHVFTIHAISNALGCSANTNEAEKFCHLNGISFDRWLKSYECVIFPNTIFPFFFGWGKKLLILIAWYSAAGVVRCHGNDNNNKIVGTTVLRMCSSSAIPVLFSSSAQLCAFFLTSRQHARMHKLAGFSFRTVRDIWRHSMATHMHCIYAWNIAFELDSRAPCQPTLGQLDPHTPHTEPHSVCRQRQRAQREQRTHSLISFSVRP